MRELMPIHIHLVRLLELLPASVLCYSPSHSCWWQHSYRVPQSHIVSLKGKEHIFSLDFFYSHTVEKSGNFLTCLLGVVVYKCWHVVKCIFEAITWADTQTQIKYNRTDLFFKYTGGKIPLNVSFPPWYNTYLVELKVLYHLCTFWFKSLFPVKG